MRGGNTQLLSTPCLRCHLPHPEQRLSLNPCQQLLDFFTLHITAGLRRASSYRHALTLTTGRARHRRGPRRRRRRRRPTLQLVVAVEVVVAAEVAAAAGRAAALLVDLGDDGRARALHLLELLVEVLLLGVLVVVEPGEGLLGLQDPSSYTNFHKETFSVQRPPLPASLGAPWERGARRCPIPGLGPAG